MSEPIIINGNPIDGHIYSASPDFVKICTTKSISNLGGVGQSNIISFNNKKVVLQSASFEYKDIYDEYGYVDKLELIGCNYTFKFVRESVDSVEEKEMLFI